MEKDERNVAENLIKPSNNLTPDITLTESNQLVDFNPVEQDNQLANVKPANEVPETIFSGVSVELMAHLTPAKVRTILLWLTGQYTKKKIAKIIGVNENTVGAWLLDPIVQEVIKDIQGREFQIIDSQLKSMRYKALETMNDLLDSDMDNVRFSAAKDILDRGGHRPQQSIKVEKTVTNLEQQLSQLADFTIDDKDVIDIDIDDIVSEVKGER